LLGSRRDAALRGARPELSVAAEDSYGRPQVLLEDPRDVLAARHVAARAVEVRHQVVCHVDFDLPHEKYETYQHARRVKRATPQLRQKTGAARAILSGVTDVETWPPGREPFNTEPGDFILVHGHRLASRLIGLGQALRFTGARRRFAHWTHAALIVGYRGEIIEAQFGGVRRARLARYLHSDYRLVHVNASPAERMHAAAYAESMADRRAGYDWTDFVSLGTMLAGSRFALVTDGRCVCSTLVANALERCGYVFQHNAECMTPADLAEKFGVYADGPSRTSRSIRSWPAEL
jgi:hypothetical protein